MCGIAGVKRFGTDGPPITGEELITLLCSVEHRGIHATGVALVNPGFETHILKGPEPAWKFTKDKSFREFLEENLTENTEAALLHTRAATVGSPLKNENNHPIGDDTSIIIHNGGVRGYEYLYKEMDATRTCETDSDIFRAIATKFGFDQKAFRTYSRLGGSGAIAVVHRDYPGGMVLARSGNPLVYGLSEDKSKLYFASEPQAIIRASRPWSIDRGMPTQPVRSYVGIGHIPDNTAWVIDNDGLVSHHAFNICQGSFHAPDYSQHRKNYHSRMKNWQQEGRKHIKNASKSCTKCDKLNFDTDGVGFENLRCWNCGVILD